MKIKVVIWFEGIKSNASSLSAIFGKNKLRVQRRTSAYIIDLKRHGEIILELWNVMPFSFGLPAKSRSFDNSFLFFG